MNEVKMLAAEKLIDYLRYRNKKTEFSRKQYVETRSPELQKINAANGRYFQQIRSMIYIKEVSRRRRGECS